MINSISVKKEWFERHFLIESGWQVAFLMKVVSSQIYRVSKKALHILAGFHLLYVQIKLRGVFKKIAFFDLF